MNITESYHVYQIHILNAAAWPSAPDSGVPIIPTCVLPALFPMFREAAPHTGYPCQDPLGGGCSQQNCPLLSVKLEFHLPLPKLGLDRSSANTLHILFVVVSHGTFRNRTTCHHAILGLSTRCNLHETVFDSYSRLSRHAQDYATILASKTEPHSCLND